MKVHFVQPLSAKAEHAFSILFNRFTDRQTIDYNFCLFGCKYISRIIGNNRMNVENYK